MLVYFRLVEEYTNELDMKHECFCNVPPLGTAISNLVQEVGKGFVSLFTDLISGNGKQENGQGTKQTSQESNPKFYECKCCTDKKEENCLKDGNTCGISHVMKYFFGCNSCNCVGVPATNGNASDGHTAALQDTDKLCKCLVKVFKTVAQNLQICNGEGDLKCPCSCASASTSSNNTRYGTSRVLKLSDGLLDRYGYIGIQTWFSPTLMKRGIDSSFSQKMLSKLFMRNDFNSILYKIVADDSSYMKR